MAVSSKKTKTPNCKILVAEDEPALRQIITLKLQKANINVAVASDGAEAWEKISTNDYSLCLLDIIMPKMNGFDVLEKIKAAGLKISVIMLTNLAQPEDIERAKALGAIDYFDKAKVPLQYIVDQVKAICKI